MHLPPGLNESDVLQAIEDAVRLLAPHFTFPGWGVDDVAQEGRLLALEALPKYEPRLGPDGKPTRPLGPAIFSNSARVSRCQCWDGVGLPSPPERPGRRDRGRLHTPGDHQDDLEVDELLDMVD